MHCAMCNIWANPTSAEEEFKPELLEKLPRLTSVNITGGEPFVRDDIQQIAEILLTKTKRIVFSTSGYFPDRIIEMAKRFPQIGYRISLEGLSCRNDMLRGREGGFDRGLKTLLELRRMGIKDIGFGITVSNDNSHDMLELYELSRNLKMQFATAAVHNSFYFHKYDNRIDRTDDVCNDFDELVQRLMKESSPKSWFRAFFNTGLINYVRGGRRLLPCEAGSENFFIDPFGNVLPCNGMDDTCRFGAMGNLHDDTFENIWNGERARRIRGQVSDCPKRCWMIGSVSPVMKKYIGHVAPWVIKNKLKVMAGGRVDTSCPPMYHAGNSDKQGVKRQL